MKEGGALKINKYCKFLIYFWTIVVFGTYSLIALLISLISFWGLTIQSNNPLAQLLGFLIGIFGVYTVVAGFFYACFLWVFPTVVLLILGFLSAPEEEEDQSGIGKMALGSAIMVIITLAGLILFLLFSQDEKTKILSFAILAITFLFDFLLLHFTFRGKRIDDSESETWETKASDSGDTIMYCSQCGKKILKDNVFCKYCGNRL